MPEPERDPRAAVASLGQLLGVWAHPDDESYLSAGLMAAAADLGRPATVVTATFGEAGFDDPERWPPERAREVRRWEAAAAMAAVGVRDHRFLDLADGEVADADGELVVGLLVDVIEHVQVDTVLTFGPDGTTGHPDHVAVGAWATEAARRSSRTPRVLHACSSAGWAERFADLHERYEVFLEPGTPVTVPDDELALHVHLEGMDLDRKLVSLQAQASQTAPVIETFGLDTYADWVADEMFVDAP